MLVFAMQYCMMVHALVTVNIQLHAHIIFEIYEFNAKQIFQEVLKYTYIHVFLILKFQIRFYII